MHKKILPCLLFSSLLIWEGMRCGFAQTKFQITIGGAGTDYGYSVQQTSDGGYIVAGYTNSFGAGGWDVYLVKTDGSGNLSWSRTFGGAGTDCGYSVQQTNDGGYIIGGFTNSFGAGNYDVYLIKTDGSGNLAWSKTFGGASSDYGGFFFPQCCVKQTNDGGYIFVGSTTSFGAGNSDVYLVKADGNGDIVWSKTFGGTGNEYGFSVKQTSDGGYIISGATGSFGAGSYDVYLLKTDSSGDLLWDKTSGMASDDRGYSIEQTSDGNYIVGGCLNCITSYEFYLLKADNNGNFLWDKTFDLAGGNAYSSQQTSDGGYIIAGFSNFSGNQDAYIVKTNGSGTLSWSRLFGDAGFDYGYSIYQSSDGGYVIVGNTNSSGAGGYDIYLIKTD